MTEYYKRFTIPLACIVFGMVGPSLGLYSRRSGRSSGVTVALIIFAVYYLIMKGGENLATSGKLEPIIAALMPNVIIGALGIYLLVMADKEKNLLSELRELFSGLKKKKSSH
jgi:lipopolysaccharide export LptBFGC system permease protein LptF